MKHPAHGARMPRSLRPRQLRWSCPRAWIPGGRQPSSGSTLPDLIGQERAVEALEMGLELRSPGYNLFVTGIRAPEKNPALLRLLRDVVRTLPPPRDHVFVHNFEDPLRPCHLSLPPGGGPKLQEALQKWVQTLRRQIPGQLSAEEHQSRREALEHRCEEIRGRLVERLHENAEERGLAVVQTQAGEEPRLDIWPRLGGEAVDPEEIPKLPDDQRPAPEVLERLLADRVQLLAELQRSLRENERLSQRLEKELRDLDGDRVRETVARYTEQLRSGLDAEGELGAWLDRASRYAIDRSELFLPAAAREEQESGQAEGRDETGLEVFRVQVVRTISDGEAPVVFELHPSYANLFGTVERQRMAGGPGWYHLAVRPGSLLEADGGFLVLNAADVIQEAEVWRALKRTLQNQRLEIHALESLSPLGATGVRPGPVRLDLKVVLVGDSHLYEGLHDHDADFARVFKVKAEFDESLPLQKEVVGRLCESLRAVSRSEGLLPFARDGLQALLEQAVRDAGRRNRISARLSTLADYAREGSYLARRAGKKRVDREAMEEAGAARHRRHSLEVDQYNRLILEDVFRIQTEGVRIGTVNALTVVSLGPLDFGRVSRVSATTSAGEESYLSIEREVEQSGPLHSRGVLMLESFMRARFGQTRTLPVKVSLAFDQNYGPIDGDSASSTEIYALLSALGRIPVRQDIAVTGAVGMDGAVTAVGGIDEKIEGFFQLCRQRGLSGTQGVVIPRANRDDLMLERDLVAAVEAGRFHVWEVETVDEGIAILTGLPAGRRRRDGSWPADSVMGRVETRLKAFETIVKGEGRQRARKGASKASSPSSESSPECRARRRPLR